MTRTEYLQKIQPHYTGYQELHVHTEASYRDAVNTVDDIVAAAKRLGRNAFAITDHGNQMRLFQGFKVRTKAEKKALEDALKAAAVPKGDCDSILKSIGPTDSIRNPTEKMWPWIEKFPEPFIAAVKNSPQYIPGIEMYFQPEKSEDDNSGYHIILYAKDWQGQKVLFLIENLAQLNKNKSGNPRTTWEDLERFVGPGALGHGHVIATSACVAGYIPSILLRRWHIADRQAELQAKLGTEDIAFSEDDLKKAETDEKTAKEKLSTAKKELAQAKKLAKTDFSTKLGKLRAKVTSIEEKEKALAGQLSFGDMTAPSAKLQAARDKLAAMEAEAEKAKKAKTNLPEYVRQVEQCKVLYDITKQHTDTIKKALRPLEKYKAAIEELEQEKSALGDLNAEAKAAALRFDELFGHGNFYIELQNHGITKENVVRPMLYQLIRDTGIPPTVANDVHYPTKEDKRKRDIIFAMKFNRQISEFENEEGIDQLYFKSNEEMAALADDEFWNIGMENTCRIAESCNVYYDKQMHLPTFDAHAAGFPDAKAYLEDFCHKMIPKKYPISSMADDKRKELLQTIEERLTYEFGVIEKMGYMSYIAIVQDFIFYGRKIGGQTAIGPGRGSAAGSLVCYLADITDIDPLRYDLLFERFLNPARVSMPDIDTDLSGAVRGKVIDYVAQKYGYKGDYPCEELRSTVCNIATESVLAPRAAVRAVARVTGVPYDVTDQLAKMIPNVPKMTLEKAENDNPEIAGFCNIDPRAKKLFEEAKLVEGIPVQTGVHAAGVIIADKPVSEYAPMFWNDEKNCWVIESDMVECESTLGLLKMDFLGLTTLDILGTTLFYIRKTRGMNIKLAKLKEANDQNVIQHIYAEGNTDGVFQFESDGIKKALVNFKPHSIDDIILMNAAYRPGPMDSIPEFTAVKLGEKDPAYLVPDMEKILGNTYGSAIYQEQIMQLFQMVGFSLGEADIIRRAMSKKHLDEIEAAKEKFVAGMKAKGASDEAVEAYWTRLLAFASYAFNKSHAAAYSILSYYTAWLKFYSPCEFMAAQMSYTPHDKVPLYAHECKRLGISIQKPDINKGVPFFAPNKGEKTIRYDVTTASEHFMVSGLYSHNCRSFLTPDRSGNGWNNIANAKNYEPGKPKYYGRYNQGVVTINLPDVALSSGGAMDKFWKIFDERLELCHKALQCRHKRLEGTLSDVSPIHWQYGALARLKKGEKIDKLLHGGYSTISLGYAGLYECCKYMTGKSHTDPEAKPFALSVMQHMNDKCNEWKAAEDIDYSLYGTPLESTTYKFAKCLEKRFGKEWEKISGGKNYITNSYHVPVFEQIDAFTKLGFEADFQKLSPGGAISYVEVPNMQDNLAAVVKVMQFIYDNIMYAELNTKSDYCQVCGYDGEIQIVEDDGKLVWKCPKCGNRDQSKLNVARRTCGYIGTQFWNQGRTQELRDRVLHL